MIANDIFRRDPIKPVTFCGPDEHSPMSLEAFIESEVVGDSGARHDWIGSQQFRKSDSDRQGQIVPLSRRPGGQ
jgi:hypothetical protein